jgi:hypothetical protein
MNQTLHFLVIFANLIILFCSCNYGVNNAQPRPNPANNNIEKSTPGPSINNDTVRTNEVRTVDNNLIFSLVLSENVPIDSITFVNQNTIKFDNYPALDKLTGVSPETIKNFIEINKDSVKIRNSFDVYAKIKLIELDDSIEKTIKKIQAKIPKSQGFVLFTRVGSNADTSQKLVYFEWYNLDGTIKKQFCLFIYDREKNSLERKYFDLN